MNRQARGEHRWAAEVYGLIGLGILLWSGAVLADAAAPAWEEVKQADGIRVLARDGEGDILKVKAVTEIAAGMDAVKAVIDDAATHPAWVPYLTETRVLRQDSPTSALLYSRFDAPWPARDRDFVYYSRMTHEPSGAVSYRLQSRQSELMPVQDDYVRALLREGVYRLEPVAEGRTRVEFMFYTDPRGRLPRWIVNIVQRRFPFAALKGLKRTLRHAPQAVHPIPDKLN